MKTLHLNLKRKWFDMILSGEKTEEYRELKEFWYGRLRNKNASAFIRGCFVINYRMIQTSSCVSEQLLKQTNELFEACRNNFDTITFSNGYTKDRDQFVIECKGIEIKQGNQKWGAEKYVQYFVLKLGEIQNKKINN